MFLGQVWLSSRFIFRWMAGLHLALARKSAGGGVGRRRLVGRVALPTHRALPCAALIRAVSFGAGARTVLLCGTPAEVAWATCPRPRGGFGTTPLPPRVLDHRTPARARPPPAACLLTARPCCSGAQAVPPLPPQAPPSPPRRPAALNTRHPHAPASRSPPRTPAGAGGV